MFITGLGTAAPTSRYSQKECWEVFSKSPICQQLEPRSRAIVRKVLTGDNGIATRRLALDRIEEAFVLSPDALHARFLEHAPALATQAAERALADARLQAAQMDAVIVSTCTGYLCPGLSSYLSQRLGLPPNVLALDLVGQGCGAALPNLRTAEALLQSGRCERVLSVCVEICSAALYFDNDPGVLISACLFGDGAGAAVLTQQPNPRRPIRWVKSTSLLEPENRDLLRFEQRTGMLRNILTPQVPEVAGRRAAAVFQQLIRTGDTAREKVRGWVLHPGGRDVLLALRKMLKLEEHDTRWSEQVLREFGNVSSSSVFFVLEAAFADSASPGTWFMSSFGAGFSCHGALLEVG
jgi:predicted naringenin-chalcone synthase